VLKEEPDQAKVIKNHLSTVFFHSDNNYYLVHYTTTILISSSLIFCMHHLISFHTTPSWSYCSLTSCVCSRRNVPLRQERCMPSTLPWPVEKVC